MAGDVAPIEAAARAAEEAALDDPSFDLDAVFAAGGETFAEALGDWTADAMEPVARLFSVDLSGLDYVRTSRLHEIQVLIKEPALWIAALERACDGRVIGATLLANARAEMWVGSRGSRLIAELTALVTKRATVSFEIVSSFWAYVREGEEWRFDHVEESWWAEQRMRTDPSGEAARIERLRAESAIEIAELPREPDVPSEIATNLPRDTAEALYELATIDERFAPDVIDAAVRRLHEGLDDRPGSRFLSARVVRVHADRTPPEIDVEVHLRAPRPSWLSLAPGDWFRRIAEVRHWRLAATSSPLEPWRLVDPGLSHSATDGPHPRLPMDS